MINRNISLEPPRETTSVYLLTIMMRMNMIAMLMTVMTVIMTTIMGCTQIPISTLSHIWVFVRLYGIVYVIIVILLLIIIMII